MKQSPYQAFPLHNNTYQGIPNGMNYDRDIFYNMLLKTLEVTDISYDYAGGSVSLTAIPANVDFVLPASIGNLTTTGTVLIS